MLSWYFLHSVLCLAKIVQSAVLLNIGGEPGFEAMHAHCMWNWWVEILVGWLVKVHCTLMLWRINRLMNSEKQWFAPLYWDPNSSLVKGLLQYILGNIGKGCITIGVAKHHIPRSIFSRAVPTIFHSAAHTTLSNCLSFVSGFSVGQCGTVLSPPHLHGDPSAVRHLTWVVYVCMHVCAMVSLIKGSLRSSTVPKADPGRVLGVNS